MLTDAIPETPKLNPMPRPEDDAATQDRASDRERPDRALVILPTYNERGALGEVVSRLRIAAPEVDILVVDDASPDGTGVLADQIAARVPRVSTLHRSAKLGLGTAYLAGFAHGRRHGYRWVVEMDADGSHRPEDLPALLESARGGAGLTLGCRWIPGGRIEGWPGYRRLISRTGTRVARLALRSRLRDLTTGFRVIEVRWLERIGLDAITAQGYGFQVELAWRLERLGCPIREIPITFVERRSGRSKMSLGIVLEALGLVIALGWRLRFGRGRRSAAEVTGPTLRG